MMKDRIVIIGANDFQNPLILKAKEMGFETHVFAWQDGSIGERTADYFYPISIVEKEVILEECKRIHPKAVVTIASDLAGITVNYIARKLGLPCNSERNILISTNKFEMRKAFVEAGISTPEFLVVNRDTDLEQVKNMQLPVIVKPTDRSGSRGITKLESWEQLVEAIDVAIDNSFEKKALVEEYLDGDEYSCECVSQNGQHHFLTITKKFTTGHPHFIETGHIEPADLCEDTIEKVKMQIFKALDALDITVGASHSEFKIDKNGNAKIIEIGSRMGGDCIGSDLVKLSTGYDFVKMTIQAALGDNLEFTKGLHSKVSAIRFILNKEDYENYQKLCKECPDKIYRASNFDLEMRQKVVDSSSRYGFYILTCDTQDEARTLTRL